MRRFSPLLALLLALIPSSSVVRAQSDYVPSDANLQARTWFQDARFGMFIHWGVYSVLGDGEWVMNNRQMSIADYERLPPQFSPTEYDPAEWVRIAKQAGMKYITITSKHHDGFAMWDSQVSDYDIVDRTPYKKDVLKLLADECQKQDMKLCFYHSHLDWHHPDYFPLGKTGQHSGRPAQGDFGRYLDYMDAQLTELLGGRYGPIAAIWFDGWWDQQLKEPGLPPTATRIDWRLPQTYALIHRLQPQCLIGNNHHVAPLPGEDFQMFEKDLPGGNTAGFNADATIGSLPLETCDTISGAWGYNKSDRNYKDVTALLQMLVRAAGNNANFLLNVGPTPAGRIQSEFVERLAAMGQWMEQNGESIYGTRGGPMPPQPWGVTTQKDGGRTLYIHVLAAKPGEVLSLRWPGLTARVAERGVQHLATGKRLALRHAGGDTAELRLPEQLDDTDTIFVMSADR